MKYKSPLSLMGCVVASVFALINSREAVAQSARPAVDDTEAQSVKAEETAQVIVTGTAERQLLLDTQTETGSRLGLTVRETPATVDILSERQMEEFGARTQIEALNRAPGVSAATPATSPGIPAMRGFTNNAVSVLYDGVRVASPIFFGRTSDAWTFERIEILKGPASVMSGEGALAGAVNLVPKKPLLGRRQYQFLASYGSFETMRLGADANVPLTDTVAMRAVASYGRWSDDIVDDSDAEIIGASLGVEYAPTDRVTYELAFDYSEDNYDSTTLGFPLVPRSLARDPLDVLTSTDSDPFVLDKAMSRVNYNYTDAVVKSDTQWLRSRVTWKPNDTIRLTNELNKYHSDRRFINAEIFTFNTATRLIDRSTGDVVHEIDYWIERPALAADFQLAGMRNRFSIGGEFSRTEFATPRLFGTGVSVDPYNPIRTPFPVNQLAPSTPVRAYDIKTKSVFAENALNFTPGWLLLVGGRQDWIDLEGRTNNVPVVRDYSALSWRVGTVFDLRPKTQLFALYSKAVASAGSFFALNTTSARFDLTPGRSVEAGIKSTWWDERFDVTFSAFRLEQDNILTRNPLDPRTTIQGGSRSARGVEMSVSVALTDTFRVTANTTFLDAEFDELLEPGGDRKGNTPDITPETVSNLFAFYKLTALPININVGLRNMGRYFGDNANTVRVKGYTAIDASISYELDDWGALKLQGRNLTDKVYANFTDFGVGQWTIGPRRSVELSLLTRF